MVLKWILGKYLVRMDGEWDWLRIMFNGGHRTCGLFSQVKR
jgi:hypothetical protein